MSTAISPRVRHVMALLGLLFLIVFVINILDHFKTERIDVVTGNIKTFPSKSVGLVSPPATTSPEDAVESHDHKQYQPTRAVVHMGIHKTGTTSIQRETVEKMEQLELNGYLMPWALMRKDYANRTNDDSYHPPCGMNQDILQAKKVGSQARFATCFFSKSHKRRKEKPCIEDLLCYGSEIAKRGKNLLISTETFDWIDRESCKRLSTYLSQWDETVIVVYHRRFYRWIVSTYYQRMKKQKIELRARKPIVDFVTAVMRPNSTTEYYCPECMTEYSYELVQRLQDEFSDKIVLIDYDDKSKGDSEESFFCHALPNATNTCKAIRSTKSEYRNRASTFDYEDLVYGAMQAKLIDISGDPELTIPELAVAVEKHQEMIYKTTNTNLPRRCPHRDVLDEIWEFSLLSQKSLFPQEFVNESETEANMKADFEEVARTTLCNLDIDKILNETAWQDFFKSLNPSV